MDEEIDPGTQKKLDRIERERNARTTFRSVAEDYLEMAYERELADATIRKKIWHIETVAAPLHKRPVADITPAKIFDLLKRIERTGRRETAKKLRGTISGMFRLAIVTMRATHDPTVSVKGALLPIKVTNRAAITDEWMFGQFLSDLEDYTGAGVIKDALRRVCRRLQLTSRMAHHDKDNEQVCTRSARACCPDGFGRRRAA